MSSREDIAIEVLSKYLHSGNSVLEVGCGAGTLSVIASSIVGDDGKVLGIDTNRAVLEYAEHLKNEQHLDNLEFQNISIDDVLNLDVKFDVIFGKDILPYVDNADSSVAILKNVLNPDGLIVFIESDPRALKDDDLPSSNIRRIIWNTLEKEGAKIQVGGNLDRIVSDAGLEIVKSEQYDVRCGNGSALFWDLRRMRQRIVSSGILTEDELNIDGLDNDLKSEAARNGYVVCDVLSVIVATLP